MGDYVVETKTGDVHNGGTNANVMITLNGANGAGGPTSWTHPERTTSNEAI